MQEQEWRTILTEDISKLPSFNANVKLSKKMDGTFYYSILFMRYDPKYDGYYEVETIYFLKEGLNLSTKDLRKHKVGKDVIDWFKKTLNIK